MQAKFLAKFQTKLGLLSKLSLIFSAALLAVVGSHLWQVPSFESVKTSYKPSDKWIVSREGIPLSSLRNNLRARSLEWVEIQNIPHTLKSLLIWSEDSRFYYHPGFDPFAFFQVIWEGVTEGRWRGASTLTMQLWAHIDGKHSQPSLGVLRKLRQVYGAILMDLKWSKEQILEAYVNSITYRGELVGLSAASKGLFEKNPDKLNFEEAALLVSLIPKPSRDFNSLKQKACRMLVQSQKICLRDQITKYEKVFNEGYRIVLEKDLLPVTNSAWIRAADSTVGTLQSQISYQIQVLAVESLREQLKLLKGRNVKDGAVLVLENKTGEVLAYVGNGGRDFSSANQVDGILAARQVGSVLKPFLYASAIEKNLLHQKSWIDDSPTDIEVGQGVVYRPRNYDNFFRGNVPLDLALGSSLNVPAVKTLMYLGVDDFLNTLTDFGLVFPEEAEFYGPSLALGAVDLSLWDLVQAYSRFSNVESDHVFSKSTRQTIAEILADNEMRKESFGTQNVLNLDFRVAVKTGTSKDMRDNWCIGFNKDYTVGVWVGNFNGEPMHSVSGVQGAAPVWARLMSSLTNAENQIHQRSVGATVHEPLQNPKITRILYPTPDMIVALDPDIPARNQKLWVEVENPQNNHTIKIQKMKKLSAKSIHYFEPKRGQMKIQLLNEKDQVVDQVKVNVR
jgi:penicillin-binding protein 1C